MAAPRSSPILPEGETPIIKVRGLRNSFGEAVIHDSLDLDVRQGAIARGADDAVVVSSGVAETMKAIDSM